MFNGRFPHIKNCSLLPHTPLSHSFSIACRPIHHEFLFLSVKLPNCLEMFQSRENTSLPSFPFSRRMNLSSVPRPLIPRILWVFFWTLLAKSVQLLEKNEYFPFQRLRTHGIWVNVKYYAFNWKYVTRLPCHVFNDNGLQFPRSIPSWTPCKSHSR